MKSPREIGEEVAHEIVRLSGGLCITRATAIIAAAIEARDAEWKRIIAAQRIDDGECPFGQLECSPSDACLGCREMGREIAEVLLGKLHAARLQNEAAAFAWDTAMDRSFPAIANELRDLRKELADCKEVIRRQHNAAAVWKKEEDYHLGRDR